MNTPPRKTLIIVFAAFAAALLVSAVTFALTARWFIAQAPTAQNSDGNRDVDVSKYLITGSGTVVETDEGGDGNEKKSEELADSTVATSSSALQQLIDGASQRTEITVDWLIEPQKIQPYNLGLPSGGKYGGPPVEVLHVGSATTPGLPDAELYVVQEIAHGPRIYRVLSGPDYDKPLLLKNMSNAAYSDDTKLFYVSDKFIIPSLDYPDEIVVGEDPQVTLVKEAFSPGALFAEFATSNGGRIALKEWDHMFTHEVVGDIYVDPHLGYFITKLPDHTPQLYRLQFPFSMSQMESPVSVMALAAELDLQFDDGSRFSAAYTTADPHGSLCPPRVYAMHNDIDERLERAGTFAGGEVFYTLKSPTDPLLQRQFEFLGGYQPRSYETFLQANPLIFWQDPLGRWFSFLNMDYYPPVEMGCGYTNNMVETDPEQKG